MPDLIQTPSTASQAARKKLRRRRRRISLSVAGLLLFALGFLLGKASAAQAAYHRPPQSTPVEKPAALPEPAAETEPSWNLMLVSAASPLPEDFSPPELTRLRGGHAIDSRVYPALQALMDAARAEGLDPLICSSYRTWDDQQALYDSKVQAYLNLGYSQTDARDAAAMWVTPPGCSEHQAGLAVDIVSEENQRLDETQAETALQQWLAEHCAEYGFILRYPADKTSLTGVAYESWHYRYVGEEAAREIMEQALCLEEYLQHRSG